MIRQLLLGLICLISSLNGFSQSHYPIIAMELQTIPIANNVTLGQPDISDSTTFSVTMKIAISDTTSINLLQVSLTKEEGDNTIILNKTFTYNVAGTFPDGTSYSRSGYEITLGLGNFIGTIRPYAELIVTNNSGATTDPIIYY